MKFRALLPALLVLGGWLRGDPPPGSNWEPLPPAVVKEVEEFFTIMNLAQNNNRIDLMMSLYTPDATDVMQIGSGTVAPAASIRERREADLKQIAVTGKPAPEVDVAKLQYQPGNFPQEFQIRRVIDKAGAAAGPGRPASEVFYVFRREAQGILLRTTVTHPLSITREVTMLPSTKKMTLGPDGLPTEVDLIGGLRLHQVTVMQWHPDSLLLKHVGGIDPIKLSRIVPEQRALFEAQLTSRLAQQRMTDYIASGRMDAGDPRRRLFPSGPDSEQVAAKEKEEYEQRQALREEAVSQHHLMLGMTRDQVRRSWGPPGDTERMTSVTGQGEWWYYDGRGIDQYGNATNGAVHFEGEYVVSLTNIKAW